MRSATRGHRGWERRRRRRWTAATRVTVVVPNKTFVVAPTPEPDRSTTVPPRVGPATTDRLTADGAARAAAGAAPTRPGRPATRARAMSAETTRPRLARVALRSGAVTAVGRGSIRGSPCSQHVACILHRFVLRCMPFARIARLNCIRSPGGHGAVRVSRRLSRRPSRRLSRRLSRRQATSQATSQATRRRSGRSLITTTACTTPTAARTPQTSDRPPVTSRTRPMASGPIEAMP